MILDGWGIAPKEETGGSAIVQVKTPFMDRVWEEQPLKSRLAGHKDRSGDAGLLPPAPGQGCQENNSQGRPQVVEQDLGSD